MIENILILGDLGIAGGIVKYSIFVASTVAVVGLSGCSNSDITCSSDATKGLVVDIVKDDLKKIPGLQYGFNIDASTYSLSGIRTKGDIASGKSCAGMLNIEFELSDALKKIQQNDPGAFQSMLSNNFREFNNRKIERNLEYTVEATDDDQMYVEVQF